MPTEVFPNALLGFYPSGHRSKSGTHRIAFTIPASIQSLKVGDKLRFVSADSKMVVLQKVPNIEIGIHLRSRPRDGGTVLISSCDGIPAGSCGTDFSQSHTTASFSDGKLVFEVPPANRRRAYVKTGRGKYPPKPAAVAAVLAEPLQLAPPNPFEAQRLQAATFKPNGACTVLVEVDGEVHRFEVPLGKLIGLFADFAAYKR